MTYLSHPVRAMRDDPISEESATLLLRLGDADAKEIAARVVLPEPAVADLCELDGLE